MTPSTILINKPATFTFAITGHVTTPKM